MTENPQIEFKGGNWKCRPIFKGSVKVGEIEAIRGEDNTIVGYKVWDRNKAQYVSNSCCSMNQAQALAEYHFGKEAQS